MNLISDVCKLCHSYRTYTVYFSNRAITCFAGTLLSYLTKLPVLGAAHGTRLAYLTSLLEITIVNNVEEVSILIFSISTCAIHLYLLLGSSYEV